MGTYKVIQDIEAEDKLLGPLTLRQFIYAIIVVVSVFIGFKFITSPGPAKYFTVILIPHTVFFAVLAAPFGHDQSNEVWLLAKIRFFLKPRKRIWDQTGIKDLVTITVPKKIERQLSKGFSKTEVQSRLKALANTIDSRGWAVKNVQGNPFQQPVYSYIADSDRLVAVSDIPREVPIEEVSSSYDILDELENPTAAHMDQLISSSESHHHQQLAALMQQTAAQISSATVSNQVPLSPPVETSSPATTQWFAAPQPTMPYPTATQPPLTPTTDNVQPQPAVSTPVAPTLQAQVASPVTPVSDPAIINLATNDDLNVATIARQADKAVQQNGSDEVVISLR